MSNKSTKAFPPATFEQLTIKAETPSVAEMPRHTPPEPVQDRYDFRLICTRDVATHCAQLHALTLTMHKLQQWLLTSMQLSHCQPLGRLARLSDNAGAMNDWLMHTGVTTYISRSCNVSHAASQPCSQSAMQPINQLRKYRLSEFRLGAKTNSRNIVYRNSGCLRK